MANKKTDSRHPPVGDTSGARATGSRHAGSGRPAAPREKSTTEETQRQRDEAQRRRDRERHDEEIAAEEDYIQNGPPVATDLPPQADLGGHWQARPWTAKDRKEKYRTNLAYASTNMPKNFDPADECEGIPRGILFPWDPDDSRWNRYTVKAADGNEWIDFDKLLDDRCRVTQRNLKAKKERMATGISKRAQQAARTLAPQGDQGQPKTVTLTPNATQWPSWEEARRTAPATGAQTRTRSADHNPYDTSKTLPPFRLGQDTAETDDEMIRPPPINGYWRSLTPTERQDVQKKGWAMIAGEGWVRTRDDGKVWTPLEQAGLRRGDNADQGPQVNVAAQRQVINNGQVITLDPPRDRKHIPDHFKRTFNIKRWWNDVHMVADVDAGPLPEGAPNTVCGQLQLIGRLEVWEQFPFKLDELADLGWINAGMLQLMIDCVGCLTRMGGLATPEMALQKAAIDMTDKWWEVTAPPMGDPPAVVAKFAEVARHAYKEACKREDEHTAKGVAAAEAMGDTAMLQRWETRGAAGLVTAPAPIYTDSNGKLVIVFYSAPWYMEGQKNTVWIPWTQMITMLEGSRRTLAKNLYDGDERKFVWITTGETIGDARKFMHWIKCDDWEEATRIHGWVKEVIGGFRPIADEYINDCGQAKVLDCHGKFKLMGHYWAEPLTKGEFKCPSGVFTEQMLTLNKGRLRPPRPSGNWGEPAVAHAQASPRPSRSRSPPPTRALSVHSSGGEPPASGLARPVRPPPRDDDASSESSYSSYTSESESGGDDDSSQDELRESFESKQRRYEHTTKTRSKGQSAPTARGPSLTRDIDADLAAIHMKSTDHMVQMKKENADNIGEKAAGGGKQQADTKTGTQGTETGATAAATGRAPPSHQNQGGAPLPPSPTGSGGGVASQGPNDPPIPLTMEGRRWIPCMHCPDRPAEHRRGAHPLSWVAHRCCCPKCYKTGGLEHSRRCTEHYGGPEANERLRRERQARHQARRDRDQRDGGGGSGREGGRRRQRESREEGQSERGGRRPRYQADWQTGGEGAGSSQDHVGPAPEIENDPWKAAQAHLDDVAQHLQQSGHAVPEPEVAATPRSQATKEAEPEANRSHDGGPGADDWIAAVADARDLGRLRPTSTTATSTAPVATPASGPERCGVTQTRPQRGQAPKELLQDMKRVNGLNLEPGRNGQQHERPKMTPVPIQDLKDDHQRLKQGWDRGANKVRHPSVRNTSHHRDNGTDLSYMHHDWAVAAGRETAAAYHTEPGATSAQALPPSPLVMASRSHECGQAEATPSDLMHVMHEMVGTAMTQMYGAWNAHHDKMEANMKTFFRSHEDYVDTVLRHNQEALQKQLRSEFKFYVSDSMDGFKDEIAERCTETMVQGMEAAAKAVAGSREQLQTDLGRVITLQSELQTAVRSELGLEVRGLQEQITSLAHAVTADHVPHYAAQLITEAAKMHDQLQEIQKQTRSLAFALSAATAPDEPDKKAAIKLLATRIDEMLANQRTLAEHLDSTKDTIKRNLRAMRNRMEYMDVKLNDMDRKMDVALTGDNAGNAHEGPPPRGTGPMTQAAAEEWDSVGGDSEAAVHDRVPDVPPTGEAHYKENAFCSPPGLTVPMHGTRAMYIAQHCPRAGRNGGREIVPVSSDEAVCALAYSGTAEWLVVSGVDAGKGLKLAAHEVGAETATEAAPDTFHLYQATSVGTSVATGANAAGQLPTQQEPTITSM